MLSSDLFKNNLRLRDCENLDSAHVLLGDCGEHVRLIQTAVGWFTNVTIDDAEISKNYYGKTTERAVLEYKTVRTIVNYSYQSKADAIVGKLTIAALDRQVLEYEQTVDREPRAGGLRPVFGRLV